jgi:hypothetical protein
MGESAGNIGGPADDAIEGGGGVAMRLCEVWTDELAERETCNKRGVPKGSFDSETLRCNESGA